MEAVRASAEPPGLLLEGDPVNDKSVKTLTVDGDGGVSIYEYEDIDGEWDPCRDAGIWLMPESAAKLVRELWLRMTDDQRVDLMQLCCRHCGTTRVPCYCGPEFDE